MSALLSAKTTKSEYEKMSTLLHNKNKNVHTPIFHSPVKKLRHQSIAFNNAYGMHTFQITTLTFTKCPQFS